MAVLILIAAWAPVIANGKPWSWHEVKGIGEDR